MAGVICFGEKDAQSLTNVIFRNSPCSNKPEVCIQLSYVADELFDKIDFILRTQHTLGILIYDAIMYAQ